MMRLFKWFTVCITYIWCYLFQLQVIVRSHSYLQNRFGVVLKSRGPMLELSQGKNSQILMDNELNILYNYIQN